MVNVQEYKEDAGSHFGLTVGADDVPALATALRRAGHAVDGYALEAVLVRLSEIREPVWAAELHFDSESNACTVRCARRAPLIHLCRRLARRLESPPRLQRLVRGLVR